MTSFRHLSAVAFAALTAPVELRAQAGYLNPAPINTFSLDAGYVVRFGRRQDNERYYRIEFDGKLLRNHGTPFKAATGLDLLAPAIDQAKGDVPALALRFEDGAATAAGGLFEALGARELPLPGLSALRLRGTGLVAANEALDQLTAAVGLETPPVRLPGLGKSGVSNWLVFGLNAERHEATDSVDDRNVALATFRAFVGKALGWRKSASPTETAAKITREFLAAAPTKAAAEAAADSIRKIPAPRRTPWQQLVLDAIVESATEAEWVSTVTAMATGTADAITDQQSAAVYAEWSGWADLSDDPEGGRFRSLFTASLDYWPFRGRDDILVRARYELGYERALPTEKRNHLLLSLGVRF